MNLASDPLVHLFELMSSSQRHLRGLFMCLNPLLQGGQGDPCGAANLNGLQFLRFDQGIDLGSADAQEFGDLGDGKELQV